MFVHVACKGPFGFAHFYGDLIFPSVPSIKFRGIPCTERQTELIVTFRICFVKASATEQTVLVKEYVKR
jgi:hypothetical protein